MKKKIHIIQFTPYYPPHIWGVEKVVEWIFSKWTYWKSFIYSGNTWQQWAVYNENRKNIIDNKMKVFFPSFDIVDNFPVPRLWTRDYMSSHKKLSKIIQEHPGEDFVVITHTRFFLSSLLGWIFARKNKLKWIHIEHGSDYVQLSSKWKSLIAYLYDKILGNWVIQKSDKVLGISEAASDFVKKEFHRSDVDVWYRGVEFSPVSSTTLKSMFPDKIIIWYIGRLYKWKNVDTLCRSYTDLPTGLKSQAQLVVIGGGEDYDLLSEKYTDSGIYFTWEKGFEESFGLQSEFDIHIHPSSPGWWLATTLLQAMYHGCSIVATPFEWAREVIVNSKNGILLRDDSKEEIMQWITQALSLQESTKQQFKTYNTEMISKNFSWEENIQKLYNFL